MTPEQLVIEQLAQDAFDWQVAEGIRAAELDSYRLVVSEALSLIHQQGLTIRGLQVQLSALRDEMRRYTARMVE